MRLVNSRTNDGGHMPKSERARSIAPFLPRMSDRRPGGNTDSQDTKNTWMWMGAN